jgi:hypothetical protein
LRLGGTVLEERNVSRTRRIPGRPAVFRESLCAVQPKIHPL